MFDVMAVAGLVLWLGGRGGGGREGGRERRGVKEMDEKEICASAGREGRRGEIQGVKGRRRI